MTTRKQANTKEKKHLDAVSSLPCVACGSVPVELHHCVNNTKRHRDHYRVIPLCKSHHTGVFSIHMARKSFRAQFGHEDDLLMEVERMLELRRILK